MKKISLIMCLAAVVTLSACSNPFAKKTQTPTPQPNVADSLAAQSQLKKFSSPEELREFFENHPNQTSNALGSPMAMSADSATKEAAAPQAGDRGGGGGFSGTNIQVEGVDEADIMKTDGGNIYAVSDKNLLIFKPNGADTALVSTTKLDARPQEMYISGNKLVVFGYNDMPYAGPADSMLRMFPTNTFAAFYDITDRAKPSLIRRVEFEGSYISSRLIENRLYFITTTYSYYPVAERLLPRVSENGTTISGESSTDRYLYPDVYYIDTPSSYNATTVAMMNLDAINEPLYSQVYFMPSGETIYASQNALYLAYTKYLNEYQLRMDMAKELLYNRLNDRERSRIDMILAIDSSILSDDEKSGKIYQVIEGYFTRLTDAEREQVTAELDAEFARRFENISKELEKTVIHKIVFTNGRLEYRGSGEATGRLLNQYSLDEHNGYLRLATTRNRSWAIPFFFGASAKIAPPVQPSDSYSNVYVLDQDLKTVGSIEDLAKGEQIYSARFMGDRAYLVTFRQVDPLFVLDLSDPAAPKVAGQLKIPGFSNYLHPLDETTIIGLGKMAVDNGAQGVDIQNLKLSLFDVSDPAAPKEKAGVTFGGKNSDSVALYDPKAFLFSLGKNLLAIPATLTKPDAKDYQAEFQGVIAFTVTTDSIKERGRVPFRLNGSSEENGQYIDDTARRNLYVGDFLYSFSPATLKVSQLVDLKPVKSIDLPRPIVEQTPKALPYVETAPAR